MAAPKMTRHDMKQDDLVTALEKTKGYIDKNPVMARNIGLAVAAVIVLGGGFWWWRSSHAAAAADLMREAQARMSGAIVPTGADPLSPNAPSYASEAERDKAALESFTKLVEGYGGTAEGRVAQYYEGMLLARAGKGPEAEAALTAFIGHTSSGLSPRALLARVRALLRREDVEKTSPLMPDLAKVQLADLKAQRGDLDGAAKMYSEVVEAKSAYPRDLALYYLATTQEKQGKTAEAAKTYGMLAKEFPNSSKSAEATRKSKGA